MEHGPLTDQITEAFDTLGPQLQAAARFVLAQPNDVALLSMREQARRAGVQPHTMTRFAQRLGLEGYDHVRSLYAAAVREGSLGFSGKAGTQVAKLEALGEQALAAEMIGSLHEQVGRLAEPGFLDGLVRVAKLLASAERVYCLGLRACHPVAAQFAYVMSFIGERAVLLDAAAGIGLDPIRLAGARDVLLVVTVTPYANASVETARYASGRGVPLVAVTDSLVSPLAGLARETIVVPIESPSFMHTIVPALAVGEILAALVAGHDGERALAAIKRTETQLAAFGIHWTSPNKRKSS